MAPLFPLTPCSPSLFNTNKPMDKFFKYRSLWNSDGDKISVEKHSPHTHQKKLWNTIQRILEVSLLFVFGGFFWSWKFLRHASSSYHPPSSFCFLPSCLSIFRKSHSNHFIGRLKHAHITYKYSMFIFAYDLKEHTKRKNNKNKLMSSREQDRARSWNTLAGGQYCTGSPFTTYPGYFS